MREERNADYRTILDGQKALRSERTHRQAEGVRSPELLEKAADWRGVEYPDLPRGSDEFRYGVLADYRSDSQFRAAAEEVTARENPRAEFNVADISAVTEDLPLTAAENPHVRDSINATADVGLGALGAIATLGERLFDGFLGGDVARQPPSGRLR